MFSPKHAKSTLQAVNKITQCFVTHPNSKQNKLKSEEFTFCPAGTWDFEKYERITTISTSFMQKLVLELDIKLQLSSNLRTKEL